ncbi:hypothetical protein KKC32_04100 [Patescibacteria group bacterium]|nr:hypothetical protein [Patescibacteria group bacterium]
MTLNKNKKISIAILVFCFAFSNFIAAGMLFPREARAELPVIDPAKNAQDMGFEVKRNIEKTVDKTQKNVENRLQKALILSAAITLRNTMVFLAQTAASQYYNFVTTGDKGEGPMFYTQSWEKFKQDIMDYTAATFITYVRDVFWDDLGFDICDPGADVKLKIVIGLDNQYLKDKTRVKPDCSLSNLLDNWESFVEDVKRTADNISDNPAAGTLIALQRIIEVKFDRKSSDIGMYLTMEDELQRQQRITSMAEEKQRTENLGAKAITSLSGDIIKTPSFLLRGHMTNELQAITEAKNTEMEPASYVISDIPESVIGAFVNTFISKGFVDFMSKKFFEKGLVQTSESYQPADNMFDTKKQVEKDVIKIKQVNFTYSTKQIDLLTEYTSCPRTRQINNCVMDNAFADAVRRSTQDKPLSVQEAIDQGLIDGKRRLIGKYDARNSNADCYQYGFCYSNLVKLRTARIIPIGWELAASQVGSEEVVSLNYVISQFNQTNPNDAGYKFRQLIDPNWILKYPATQCNALVNGPLLIDAGSNTRAEVCVDMPSCVRTDAKGKCLSWGYCAAEKNVFRLGGDECSGVYDSCRSLQMRKGKSVNLVMNTVDRSVCDATNAGCKWYSTEKILADNSWNWVDADASKILLNKNIENAQCNPNQEGCTRFVKTASGLGTNLVVNGDFEIFSGRIDELQSTNIVTGWAGGKNVVSESYEGGAAVKLAALENLIIPNIEIAPKKTARYFAVSGFVKKKQANASAVIELVAPDADGLAMSAVANKDITAATATDSWEKIYKIWQVKVSTGANPIVLDKLQFQLAVAGGDAIVDNVMVEELSLPAISEMHEFNEYASQNVVYVKKAPEYLGCYNTIEEADYGRPKTEADIDVSDDAVKTEKNKGCSDFAGLCSAEDVGCQNFTPTDRGRAINGVAGFADYCPQQCAGYATFNQSKTYFENGEFPLYFMPNTAKTCSAASAGCDEFTNLDELSRGGESKEYYSELRQCQKLPEGEAQCANYYTWVGGGVSGYQLQNYVLKKELGGNAPAMTIAEEENLTRCNAEIFAVKSNPDCREFYDDAGRVSYRLYSKTLTCSENCHPYRRTLQYADQAQCELRQGQWNTGECVFMAIPGEGKKCSAPAAGCREYKGNFSGDEEIVYENNFATGEVTSLQGSPMSLTTQADGQYLMVEEKTEIESVNGIEGLSCVESPRIYTKNALLSAVGDYVVSFWIKGDPTNFNVDVRPVENINTGDRKFLLGDGTVNADWQFHTFNLSVDETYASGVIGIRASQCERTFYIDNFKITKVNDLKYLIKNSWSTPAICDNELTHTPANEADRQIPQAQLGCREYRDSGKNTHYLKNFTNICSADKVGCETMIDTKNSSSPFEQGYKKIPLNVELCSSYMSKWEAVPTNNFFQIPGTAAVVNENLQACTFQVRAKVGGEPPALSQTYENMCGYLDGNWNDGVCYLQEIEKDSLIYLVNTKDKQCKNTEKGCTALGLPTLMVDAEGNYIPSQDKWNNVFYKLDPDTFDSENSPLCANSDLRCEEFKGVKGETYYFKDPGDKTCEYRKAQQGSESIFGWFKKKLNDNDPDVLCETKNYYEDGNSQIIRINDEDFSGWAGICKSSADLCTAFVDPTDKTLSDKGKAYYYVNNEDIDKTSCSDVSRKEGCILMNDTSMLNANGEPDLKWQGYLTYFEGNDKQSAVPPKNASTFDSYALGRVGDCTEDDYCKKVESCVNAEKDYLTCAGEARAEQINTCTDRQIACTFELIASKNDANSIVKVVRDRECAAWYDCKSSHWAWDSNKNKYIEVCDDVGVCDKLSPAEDTLKCAHFIVGEDNNNLLSLNKPLKGTDETDGYQNRNVSWSSLDYTGMAIPDMAPVNFYNSFDLRQGRGVEPDKRCGGVTSGNLCVNDNDCGQQYCFGNPNEGLCSTDADCGSYCGGEREYGRCEAADDCSGGRNCISLGNICRIEAVVSCEEVRGQVYKEKDFRLVNQLTDTSCEQDSDCTDACTVANPSGENCRCLSGICVQTSESERTFQEAAAPECRAYPKDDSPFPAGIAGTDLYVNANISWLDVDFAEINKNEDYGCYYREVQYGGGAITKYVPKTELYSPADPEQGFCQDSPDIQCQCDDFDYPQIDSSPMVKINNKTMCSSIQCSLNSSKPISKGNEPGLCMKKKGTAIDYHGWEGYCLQEDISLPKNNKQEEHPCITWYPTEALAGLQDLQNQYDSAGFWPQDYGFSDGSPYYCLKSSNWEKRQNYNQTEEGYRDCDGGALDACNGETKEVRENCLPAGLASSTAGIECDGNGSACVSGNPNVYTRWTADKLWDRLVGSSNVSAGTINANTDPFGGIGNTASCWTRDCGGEKFERPSCDKNYNIGGANSFEHDGGIFDHDGATDECSLEDEDWFKMTYQCKPINMPADQSAGWYKDAAGNTNAAIGEISKQSCDTAVGVSDENGKNKAFTNEIYKSVQIPDQPKCNPLGALALTGGIGETIYNLFLGAGCNQEENYPEGGIVYQSIDALKKYFAAAKTYYEMKIQNIEEKTCTSIHPEINGLSCTSDSNVCTTAQYPLECNILTLRHCNNQSGANSGNPCFWDTECVNTAPVVGNAGNRVYCTANLPNIERNEANCIWQKADRSILAEHWLFIDSYNFAQQEISAECYVGRTLENNSCPIEKYEHTPFGYVGTVILKEVVATNPPEMKSDPSASCSNIINIPSNADGIGYLNNPNKIWDISNEQKVGVPMIAAAIPSGRSDAKGNVLYGAIPNTMTIRGQTSGDIVSLDGQLAVTMNFYAWANDDQMPIRNVTIDWGERVQGVGVDGKYQNHKPRCQRPANEPLGICNGVSGLACSDDSACYDADDPRCEEGSDPSRCFFTGKCSDQKDDRFGDTTDACMESYFSYNNTYTCNLSDPVLKDCGTAGADPNYCRTTYQGNPACQYIPRVIVTDNWGWCNGTCGGADGCYNEGDFPLCDPLDEHGEPGTSFDGKIIVLP